MGLLEAHCIVMNNWDVMRGIGVWKTCETDNKLVMDTVRFNFVSNCVEMQAKGGKPPGFE